MATLEAVSPEEKEETSASLGSCPGWLFIHGSFQGYLVPVLTPSEGPVSADLVVSGSPPGP